jgi:hypothetical protein
LILLPIEVPGGRVQRDETLGAIIGAGAGVLIGRTIDDGDIVCR